MTNALHLQTLNRVLIAMLVLSLTWLAGCPNRELKPLTPCVVSGVVAKIQQNPADKIDVLFVVDNSFSMDAEQAALSEQFQNMVRILVTGDIDNDGKQDSPPVTDLHLGVVSTDLGVGGLGVADPVCDTSRIPDLPSGWGDDGVLQTKGDTAGNPECDNTYPSFLSFSCDDDNGECATSEKTEERDQLAEDFACVAKLGTGGCGLEQPLEAALKALSDPAAEDPVIFTAGQGHGGADDPYNAGFLRPDSLLAIVLVTDEEDCSSPDPLMFESEDTIEAMPAPRPINANITYRCVDQDWGDADRLYPVDRYVDGFLKLREGKENLLVYAAITGVPQSLVDNNTSETGNYNFAGILGDNQDPNHPLTQTQSKVCIYNPVEERSSAEDVLRPSCGEWAKACGGDFSPADQFAFAPRRIVEVAQELAEPTGGNAVVQSICPLEGSTEPDFSGALTAILTKIGDALSASTCLPRELSRNAQNAVNCSVIETLPVGVTCDSQPGRTLKETKDGLEVCVVNQLITLGDQTEIPEGNGWYYDDFTLKIDGEDSPRVKYCGEEGRRVAFTSAPAAGASVRLECTQPVKSVSSGEPGSLGTSCQDDADACMAGLACEPKSLTCQYTCSTNVDCSKKASSAFVCNLPEGASAGFCVTPTCQ